MKHPRPTPRTSTDSSATLHVPGSIDAAIPTHAMAALATTLPSHVPMPVVLTDAEIDEICAGLRQNAAKVRYLRQVLQVPVIRKPNGRPLVLRSDWERRGQSLQNGRLGGGPKWSKTA